MLRLLFSVLFGYPLLSTAPLLLHQCFFHFFSAFVSSFFSKSFHPVSKRANETYLSMSFSHLLCSSVRLVSIKDAYIFPSGSVILNKHSVNFSTVQIYCYCDCGHFFSVSWFHSLPKLHQMVRKKKNLVAN